MFALKVPQAKIDIKKLKDIISIVLGSSKVRISFLLGDMGMDRIYLTIEILSVSPQHRESAIGIQFVRTFLIDM